MSLRCRSKLACEIAQVNPDRLNEWVKNDTYPCAPETEAGSARIFARDDVVALMIFSQCIHFKIQAAQAGDIALLVFNTMAEYRPAGNEPDELQSVTLLWTAANQWAVRVNDEHPDFETISQWRFNITELRRRVDVYLEDARQNMIVGE